MGDHGHPQPPAAAAGDDRAAGAAALRNCFLTIQGELRRRRPPSAASVRSTPRQLPPLQRAIAPQPAAEPPVSEEGSPEGTAAPAAAPSPRQLAAMEQQAAVAALCMPTSHNGGCSRGCCAVQRGRHWDDRMAIPCGPRHGHPAAAWERGLYHPHGLPGLECLSSKGSSTRRVRRRPPWLEPAPLGPAQQQSRTAPLPRSVAEVLRTVDWFAPVALQQPLGAPPLQPAAAAGARAAAAAAAARRRKQQLQQRVSGAAPLRVA
eukprot:TRINITY_DN21075_c0_g1_i1.p3 TRINITY_DN21075_c0_g1~~TRINITY_DN21075_c0_g1_i1.p3  ORF type:complete len:262 (+),score=72.01 TRINITY_DN21075_c0_g1_i1:109-894(+)